jgi:hypothetical protein
MPNTHPSPPPRRFQVRVEQMLDWLATATDSMGQPFADTYGLDHTFRPDGVDLHERIQMLAGQAQTDGVLALRDHHLELWQVADEGFLLTLDSPLGPRLCSQHVSIGDLIPDETAGVVAAFAFLTATARAANNLLDEQDQAARRTHLRAPRPVATSGATRAPLGPPPDAHATDPADPGRPRRR